MMLRTRDIDLYMLPYCVYVLFSLKDLKLYHGFTTCLQKRIGEHNRGETKNTCGRRSLVLIHSEFYLSKKDVLRRESYFKTSPGRRLIKLLLRETLIAFK